MNSLPVPTLASFPASALAGLGGVILAAAADAQTAARLASAPGRVPAGIETGSVLATALLHERSASGDTDGALPETRVPAYLPRRSIGAAVPQEEPERWSSFLPLLKEEALARGYELPLPFGAGVTSTVLLGRDIQVTDLRIGVDGGPPTSVSRAVDLGSESDVFNANVKLDVWLLPFLNLYTLLGYVYNESQTKLHVALPGPGGPEFDLDVESELDGFVGGGGLTLAAGYDDFFLVVDSNYSQTDIGFDDSFRAVTASMRAGYQTELGRAPLQVWLGGAYWDTENTAKGHADVPGVGRVDFEADQGPTYPWVLDVGANFRAVRACELFFDFASDLHGGIIATAGAVFRF